MVTKKSAGGPPPPKEGYTRIYTDHTGRYYHDYSEAEMVELVNDPFLKALSDAVQEEVAKELAEKLKEQK